MYYISEDLYNYRNRLFNVLLLVIARPQMQAAGKS